LKGDVNIGKDTLIHANSYIAGPVVIGKGCEIGPDVCSLPATSIGDTGTIAPFSKIQNCVIENDVHINSHSILEDSVVDAGCVIGSHFSACCDEAEVKIDHEHYLVRIGAMLGRSCRIANMVTAESGSIIGNYSHIKSLKTLSGTVPDRSLVV
jgi:glucose-1-phosphate thymidylyltransferase